MLFRSACDSEIGIVDWFGKLLKLVFIDWGLARFFKKNLTYSITGEVLGLPSSQDDGAFRHFCKR